MKNHPSNSIFAIGPKARFFPPPSALGASSLTFNYFLRVTPIPQKNDQDRLSFAERRSLFSSSRSGWGSGRSLLGEPNRVPAPASPHARPRLHEPAQAMAFTNGEGVYNTRSRGDISLHSHRPGLQA